MISVFTEKITPRNRYAFNLFFKEVLNIEVRITENIDEFKAYSGAKVNYSRKSIENSLQFMPANLLFEKDIDEQKIEIFQFQGLPAFFRVEGGAMEFDPFAVGFYLVTRYEEYLPHKNDKFGRFDAEESLAFKHDFLSIPVVNAWAHIVKQLITQSFPEVSFPDKQYCYLPTIDVDNAFAYKGKGLLRSIGGALRSLGDGRSQDVKQRWQVLFGKKKDPYNTFQKLSDLHNKYGLKPIYFFLLGDYGEHDKNVSYSNQTFQSLIKSVADYFPVAIHPSYASNNEPSRIRMEKERLQKMVHRNIETSRQHFIKLSMPETYRNLIEAGIKEDYSMGYPSQLGFRASIATPFYFYDIDREENTSLKVYPFQLMEVTLKHYLKLDPQQALQKVKEIVENTKKVHGDFCSVWHNESLSGQYPWEGWEHVYEKVIQLALEE